MTDIISKSLEKTTIIRKRRIIQGKVKKLITFLTVILACFQLYTAFFGLLPAMQQRSFHLCFVMSLIFLLYPMKETSPHDKPSFLDWILASFSILCTLYIFINYTNIAQRAGMYRGYEVYLGAIMVILVFEATRRVMGLTLPIFCSFFLLFAYYGRLMPVPLKHFGLSIPRIVEELYLTTDGIFGLVLGVSATYIFLFVLFGAFLQSTGVSKFFNEISLALAGHLKGGPAKIAVLSSALMGTVSGSTSANVATTGSFTILLMKDVGYKNYFAGAVEAAASTGGQIMPPVMGAASFIIADTLGIPYIKVLIAALVPAILYFWGIWCSLDLEAQKLNLKGLKKEELPSAKRVIIKQGYKIIPLIGIIYFLVKGRSPLYAGSWGIILTVLLSFIDKKKHLNLKKLIETFENGSKTALPVAIACTIVGIVIGIMGATGVALNIGDAVLLLTKESLILTLIVAMMISLLLGMGMPTTASYVMASTVAAPALILLGQNSLNVHLFVFYFAVLSSITPPVCVGAYTAAGIAGSNPNKTGFTAMKLALAGFIIPYVIIFSPELLLTNYNNLGSFILGFISAVVGVFGLALTTEGFYFGKLSLIERMFSLIGAICLIIPGLKTDILGYFILIFIIYYKRKYSNN